MSRPIHTDLAGQCMRAACAEAKANGLSLRPADLTGRQRAKALTVYRRHAARLMLGTGLMQPADVARAMDRDQSTVHYWLHGA